MPIEDIAGVGKAIEKLINELSRHFGRFTQPVLTRRNASAGADQIRLLADAEAYRVRVLGEANAEVARLLTSGEAKSQGIIISSEIPEQQEAKQLVARTTSRVMYEQLKEQDNIERITEIAADELEHTPDKAVADQAVDKDWLNQFFDIAGHISKEDMQLLWGKILAGEVKQPGSYSLRTLDVVRKVTKEEAEIFRKIAPFCIRFGRLFHFVASFDEIEEFLRDKRGIRLYDRQRLDEAGLFDNSDNVVLGLHKVAFSLFESQNVSIVARLTSTEDDQNIAIRRFTRAGDQLLGLVDTEPDMEYLEMFVNKLQSTGAKLEYTYIGPDGRQTRPRKYERLAKLKRAEKKPKK